ncbi:hypothetical protein KJ359_006941 [Pestalotiopsis sp. 9143b]|nr:hypothetical protein KJ359_006941 [Pestalotiopsis sp. 9143b]
MAAAYPITTSTDKDAVKTVLGLLPIETNSITKFDANQIRADAAATRIIVDHRFPALVEAFLEHKRAHGSDAEKDVYQTAATWSWEQQTRRLIEKRPLMFMGGSDSTVMRDGVQVNHMRKEWDRVGTDAEVGSRYLRLTDYLSYDEIMLGSLVGVSGPSYFINTGERHNVGRPGARGTFEPRGIVVGLVGARFERADRMDSVFCIPAVARPRQHQELTQIFADFFGRGLRPERPFNHSMYKERIKISASLLLCEANERAKAEGKRAYVHVVGLGLGVWAPAGDRDVPEAYVEAFADVIEDAPGLWPHVGTVNFSHLRVSKAAQDDVAEAGAKEGVDVLFSLRAPADPLPDHKKDELLVVSYAWDGNSFPGNEYWNDSLSASGDPAQACMSTIAELHNPILNPQFLNNIQTLP